MQGPIIDYFIAGPFEVMTYLVGDPISKEAAIIDPAGRLSDMKRLVEEGDLLVRYIILTHCHVDHILALKEYKEVFSAPVAMHESDIQLLKEGYDSLFGDITQFQSVGVDLPLRDGDILSLGNMEMKVLHTPGHTPGSICILIDGNLFTGDTLFVGAVGRTDLKGGSFDRLLKSIKERILPLPDDTVIWP
ncbi:MAG: MBL fold metallo-hydrolase, partial [Desulfatiglandales bacterium]